MKAPRLLITASVIVFLAVLSFPAPGAEYAGSFFQWTGAGTFTDSIYVSAAGAVSDVSILIRNAQTSRGFENNALLLTSPEETTIYLFDQSAYRVEGTSLYQTRFIDSAPVIITEGVSPYAGSFRPGESFSNLAGEWMTGTWTLAVYNQPAGQGNPGAVTDWSLIINQSTPVPTLTPTAPTPTPVPITYREYHGDWFTWTGNSTVERSIRIANSGMIADVNVKMNVDCSASLEPVGMYLVSPGETITGLFNQDDLEDTTMYLTTFDDSADRSILNGTAPYIGLYLPVQSLALFNNQTATGDWTLVVNNEDGGNNGMVSSWSLIVAVRDYQATPTITPVATRTPSATATPPPTPAPFSLILQSGDYAGDGTSDIGVFRAASGLWSVRGVGTSFFGQAGDVPASGDYDGDGTSDLALFRPASALWAIYGVTRVYYGTSGDTAVPADFTGDGMADIGIFRPATGLWAVRGLPRVYFGAAGDFPVPADFTGDGVDDPAIYRPAGGLWAVSGVTRVYFGTSGDLPLARDFSGDGTADLGIFRASSGLWAIRGWTRFYFGVSGDYPVGADFVGDWTDYPGVFRGASGLWAVRGVTRVYYGKSGDIPIAR